MQLRNTTYRTVRFQINFTARFFWYFPLLDCKCFATLPTGRAFLMSKIEYAKD